MSGGSPSRGPGQPMSERSTAGVIWMFIVFPILSGVALLGFTIVNATSHGQELTATDWFWQVGYVLFLGLGLLIALPAAGWQELRRRRESSTRQTASGQCEQ